MAGKKTKNFSDQLGAGLNSLIRTDAETPEEAEERTEAKQSASKEKPAKNKPEKPKLTAATVKIEEDNLHNIKAYAYWERKKIQDVVNEALRQYFENIPEATLKKAKSSYDKES